MTLLLTGARAGTFCCDPSAPSDTFKHNFSETFTILFNLIRCVGSAGRDWKAFACNECGKFRNLIEGIIRLWN